MFSIPFGIMTNIKTNIDQSIYSGPITNYSSIDETGNNSFSIANGFRATFSQDNTFRGGELNYRKTDIISEQILTDVLESDLIKFESDTVENINNIISELVNNAYYGTVTGVLNTDKTNNSHNSSDIEFVDSVSGFGSGLNYGWGFHTQISNTNITHMTINKFHFRNASDLRKLPINMKLWGKESISDSWILICFLDPDNKNSKIKKGVHSAASTDTTTKFKYFRLFFNKSTDYSDGDESSQITDFWLEGHGYKLN